MMKRLTTFLALLIAVGGVLSPSASNAQTKHVLCEEFTGAWCGFCPQGIWAIQNLDSIYGDQFIPVAFHDANGEPMEIATGRDTMSAGAYGFPQISGFPDGWLNRNSYDGSTWNAGGTNAGLLPTWQTEVAAELAKPADADVTMANVTFDPKTRMVSVDLGAKFYNDVSGDIRLNLYVVEDSISGPAGSSYDQHNYLTGGAYASLDPTSPWHTYPAQVPGFMHMHVVREVVCGAWGAAGIVPSSVTAGASYTKTMTFLLPPNVHAERTSLVGFAFYYNQGDITSETVLNANRVKLTNLPAVSSTIANGVTLTTSKPYITATPSAATTQTLTVHNTTAAPVSVGLVVDAMTTGLSNGWTVTIAPNTLSVPANGTATATATFNAPAQAGYSVASFAAWPQVDGATSIGTEVSVGALSANTKYISYGGNGWVNHGFPAAYANDFASVPFTTASLAAYPATNFDLAVFPNYVILDLATGYTGPTPAIVPIINQMLAANKKVFLISENGLYNSFDKSSANYNACHTAAITTLFNTKFGVKYLAQTTRYNTSTGQLISYDITGVTGDPIGDGINAVAVANNQTGKTDIISLTNSNSTMCFYSDDDNTSPAGFRYDGGDGQGRAVYLDFYLSGLGDLSSSDQIVTNSINWLLKQGTGAVNAQASANAGLSVTQNPFSTNTVVRYSAAQNEKGVSMTLVDVLGREVASITPHNSGNGLYTATLSGTGLANGTYHLVVRSTSGMQQLPVMIAR